nr:hypothetical protein [uncultured Duganella sp.]
MLSYEDDATSPVIYILAVADHPLMLEGSSSRPRIEWPRRAGAGAELLEARRGILTD